MNDALYGKRVLVFGGSSGIGLTVARKARQQGAHILIASRKASDQIAQLSEAVDGPVEAYSADIVSEQGLLKILETVGAVDHLVIAVRPDIQAAPFEEVDIEEGKRAFDTKFWGPFRLIQKARRFINPSGSIVLTSGIAGEKIYPGSSIMAVINSATETLCRTLAVELAPLRINVVSPGYIEPKPMTVQEMAVRFPAGRIATRDEVADVYLYLMSNPYITGTIMVVDGGARLI